MGKISKYNFSHIVLFSVNKKRR